MNKCTSVMLVSDDHNIDGFNKAYEYALKKYNHIDYVIHAGDIESRPNSYYENIAGCPVYIVRGNNDFNNNPEFIETVISGKKFFVSHGHKYGVYMGLQNLAYAGAEREADVIVFGHTHRAFYINHMGMDIVNPGSLTQPRGGSNGSFAMLFIENDTIKVEHIAINW